MSDRAGFVVRRLEESAVAIVGGTSGIGLATAHAFAQAGVPHLALIGRDEERGRRARDGLQAAAPNAEVAFFAADANVPEQAQRAAESARAHGGRIDVLITATTSAYLPRLLHEIPVDDIPRMLTAQAAAPLLMTRIVLPWMREQRGGCIINVASDAAKMATPGESVIGAAMAAIVMFTRTAAIEAKRDGVRINAITPSLVDGTGVTELLFSDEFSGRLFSKARELADLGVSLPEDQAALLLYLASPQAAKLTGQAISLNGGISAA
jgi:2-hydroxycyclohexanecarboxyl-CoA dehydrogenase